MDFTPNDWITIGTSLIGAWWFGRFACLFALGMFGGNISIPDDVTIRLKRED